MNNTTLIQLGSFKDMVAAAANPLGSGVREAFVAFLTSDSRRIGQAYREHRSEDLACAEAEEARIRAQVGTNQLRVDEADGALDEMLPGSWLMGAVSLICFIVCFAAEYVFNSAVVPWLVSVSPRSLLGVALSMAPATAPVILDRVIAGLFDVHDSWQAVKAALLTP